MEYHRKIPLLFTKIPLCHFYRTNFIVQILRCDATIEWQMARPIPKILFYLKAIVKKVKIEFHRTRVHLFRELRCVQNQINWLINEMKYRGALSSASKLNNSYTLPAGKCIWQHVISFTFWNTFAR